MVKPADILDSKPYCDLLLTVANNPNSSIGILCKKVGKTRTTVLEQLNRLKQNHKLIEINSGIKSFAYSVNYSGLVDLFYHEILKKSFGIDEKEFSISEFRERELESYIREAILSLGNKFPSTTIRALLSELFKTFPVYEINTETSHHVDGIISVSQKITIKKIKYLKLQGLLLKAYYASVSPKFEGGIFEKFRDSLEL